MCPCHGTVLKGRLRRGPNQTLTSTSNLKLSHSPDAPPSERIKSDARGVVHQSATPLTSTPSPVGMSPTPQCIVRDTVMVASSSLERIRILSLDGGGVRGLSSLLILRELMVQLHASRRAAGAVSADSEPPRPCDVFDLIVGSGTGGVSALLLGRLHLSVDEAIDAYLAMTSIFTRSSFLLPLARQSESIRGRMIESQLRALIVTYLHEPDALIFDSTQSRCRVAVLAATSDHADAPPCIFRTYSEHPSFKLVDVARASSSTPGLFSTVSLGHPAIEYLDAGSVGYNNPTEIALEEAHRVWPSQHVKVVLSLGTGSRNIVDVGLGNNLMQISGHLIRSCDAVHNRLVQSLSPLSYFRFSVDKGLEGISAEDGHQTERLAAVTSGYLRLPRQNKDLDLCVRAIDGRADTIGVMSPMYCVAYNLHVADSKLANQTPRYILITQPLKERRLKLSRVSKNASPRFMIQLGGFDQWIRANMT